MCIRDRIQRVGAKSAPKTTKWGQKAPPHKSELKKVWGQKVPSKCKSGGKKLSLIHISGAEAIRLRHLLLHMERRR